jgi:hypothetical protein
MMNNRSRMLCYFALPVLLLAACVLQPLPASAQMTSVGIDCSQIQALQLLKQDNLGAGKALIECGIVRGGQPSSAASKLPKMPPNIRVSNRACSDQFHCTKSESNVWASTKNPNQIVVNYNDSAGDGSDYSGTSYSADGGKHFKEIQPPPFGSAHGSNFGDPIVVFNSKMNKFFAGDIVSGCGGFGLGLWTSSDGKTWTVGSCAHNGGSDDRESMWVDNEPTSGTYGRMYVSWNDFALGGSLSVTYSDDGVSWVTPIILNANFIRDVQVTGSPRGAARFEGNNSTVFVAAMDEGGGGANNRTNWIYKSLDGGATWTAIQMGAPFAPIQDGFCDNTYFVKVNPIIRHMGWGEPAVGPKGVVHYVYAGLGKSGDPGDIFYQRSKDNGATWSAPIKLNTDKDAAFKSQWMPSLSSDSDGEVTASWYDRRKATSACNVATDPGCSYERVARQSKNNGASWLAEAAISPVIPQPQQPDPTVQACYAGDYDYNTALGKSAYVTWTDGRRSVGGIHVQDVEFAKVPLP